MTFLWLGIGAVLSFVLGLFVGSVLAWRSAEQALGIIHEEDAQRRASRGRVLYVDFSGRRLPPAA